MHLTLLYMVSDGKECKGGGVLEDNAPNPIIHGA